MSYHPDRNKTSMSERAKTEAAIEALVDAHGLIHVLDSVMMVCFHKADRLVHAGEIREEGINAEADAEAWRETGRRLLKVINKVGADY